MASLPEESAIWFAIALVCFFCFTIGYRTRLFQVLSLAMTTSLHERVLYAENWGTVVLAELLVWTLFLPLGRRFSVDALRASLRARPGETPEDLAAGPPAPDATGPTSLAVLGLLLQIAIIYWFNFAYKTGATWRDGDRRSLRPVAGPDRHLAGAAGADARAVRPDQAADPRDPGDRRGGGLPDSDAAVLAMDAVPGRGLLAALHVGIALLANLGIFSPAMMALLPFLLTDAQWALFARLVPRKGGRASSSTTPIAGSAGRWFGCWREWTFTAGCRGWPAGRRRRFRRVSMRNCWNARSWCSTLSAAGARPGLTGSPRSSARCRSGGSGPGRCGCRGFARWPTARMTPSPGSHRDFVLAGPGRLRDRSPTSRDGGGRHPGADAAARLVRRAGPAGPGDWRRAGVPGVRRRGAGDQSGADPETVARRTSTRMDDRGDDVPQPETGLGAVRARGAVARTDRGLRRGHAAGATRRSLQRGVRSGRAGTRRGRAGSPRLLVAGLTTR